MNRLIVSSLAVALSFILCECVARLGIVQSPLFATNHKIDEAKESPKKERLLLLGDSFTLETPTSWSTQLKEWAQPKDIVLLNVSKKGIGIGASTAFLHRFGEQFRPTTIVVNYFVGNDITDEILAHKKSIFIRGLDFARKYSYFLDSFTATIEQIIDRRHLEKIRKRADFDERGGNELLNPFLVELKDIHPEFFTCNISPQTDECLDAAARIERHIIFLKKQAKDLNAKLVILISPADIQVQGQNHNLYRRLGLVVSSDTVKNRATQDRILKICRIQQIDCLDLLPVLKQSSKEPLYLPNDFHWNALGNRKAVDAILGHLKSLWS